MPYARRSGENAEAALASILVQVRARKYNREIPSSTMIVEAKAALQLKKTLVKGVKAVLHLTLRLMLCATRND